MVSSDIDVRTAQDLWKDYQVESTGSADNDAGKLKYFYRQPSPGSVDGLAEFLDKYPPSNTKSSGNDFWVWVYGSRDRTDRDRKKDEREEAQLALAKAHQELAELKVVCDKIDADPNIPDRTNKAQGKSKKQRKKALTDKLEDTFPALAKQAEMKTGKWLFFPSAEYVDITFKILAWSVTNGPLSKLTNVNCFGVKAACADTLKEDKHVIVLYFEDVWDRDQAHAVLKCVIRHHCLFPSAAKTDLYTVLGIDRSHWSGIKSSIYTCNGLIPKDVQDELKAEYQAEKAQKQAEAKEAKKAANAEDPAKAGLTSKSFDTKKDVKDDEGFESDEGKPAKKESSPSKKVKEEETAQDDKAEPQSTTTVSQDTAHPEAKAQDSGSETEEEEIELAPQPAKHKAAAARDKVGAGPSDSVARPAKKEQSQTEDDEGESSGAEKRTLPPGFTSAASTRPDSATAMAKRRKALGKGGF
ncbi:unnamed protein product [Sympodiomycopsis kandeliae]